MIDKISRGKDIHKGKLTSAMPCLSYGDVESDLFELPAMIKDNSYHSLLNHSL